MNTSKKTFVVVDYGMGNLKSVVNAFKFLGESAKISNKRKDIEKADAIIIPGVGAFGEAMNNLQKLDLVKILNKKVLKDKVPMLGICLGMQLIAQDSEEGGFNKGFGWIDGHVRKIKVYNNTRLPHVGWNDISILKKKPLFNNISKDCNFYFVHSYYVDCDESIVSAETKYDVKITAAIQKENMFATQFHPEKSQENGLRVLKGFINFVQNYKYA
ncbi:MAG: imidazole glycerol phosphate synthase, glutamine amidotransferase subunit [Candidatus Levybacteria bacterium RIFCSPHIGHO2_01_FULL_36_15]|nr:MAG: imidazole glycerol phosphate synthase, glutamine amidotransferase subunit [Candidatus Levybacteria bacterium RIFCSPHIGHO2_01_FULL_36_15]